MEVEGNAQQMQYSQMSSPPKKSFSISFNIYR